MPLAWYDNLKQQQRLNNIQPNLMGFLNSEILLKFLMWFMNINFTTTKKEDIFALENFQQHI